MTQTKQTPLLPAYLVVGENELKRQHAVERMYKRVSELGDIDLNYDAFDGTEATGAEIVVACNTVPFASEKKLVKVASCERLKKADSSLVVDYLKQPSESCVLLLVADKLSASTALYKAVAAIGKTAIVTCDAPKRRDLPAQVRNMMVSHGATMTPGAASALVDLVGSDMVAIDSALTRLALGHRGSDPVTEGEVMDTIARTAEIKPWEFVDRFSERNLPQALALLNRMDKVSPHALIGFCTTRIRELLTVKALDARGESHSLGKVLKLPDWRVKNHRRWARNFSTDELIEALALSRDTEQDMKSGDDADAAFLEFVIAVLKR